MSFVLAFAEYYEGKNEHCLIDSQASIVLQTSCVHLYIARRYVKSFDRRYRSELQLETFFTPL